MKLQQIVKQNYSLISRKKFLSKSINSVSIDIINNGKSTSLYIPGRFGNGGGIPEPWLSIGGGGGGGNSIGNRQYS